MGNPGPNDPPIPPPLPTSDPKLVSKGGPPGPDPLSRVFDGLFAKETAQAHRGDDLFPIPLRGDDLRHDVTLTPEEAALGAEKTLRFQRWESCGDCGGSGGRAGVGVETCRQCQGTGQASTERNLFLSKIIAVHTCSRCQGTGRMAPHRCRTCRGGGRVQRICERSTRIPAGVVTGARMLLQGEGDADVRGGPAGDLYVVFEVKDPSETNTSEKQEHKSKSLFGRLFGR